VPIVAKLDVSAFVIDCAPNMPPEQISERTEPLVRVLRAAHADTPIVLVENIRYQQAWFTDVKRTAYMDKNAALKAAYDRLKAQGVKGLYYIPCDNLLGDDSEATVDGTHPTDLGFMRMADTIEPVLRRILK
jgi:lysophospholipase L1-like esterase